MPLNYKNEYFDKEKTYFDVYNINMSYIKDFSSERSSQIQLSPRSTSHIQTSGNPMLRRSLGFVPA